MLVAIIVNLFCIFPCSITLLNKLLFERLIGFPLVAICCSKKGSSLGKNLKEMVNITNAKIISKRFNHQKKLNKAINFHKIEPENMGNLDDNVSIALDSDRDSKFGAHTTSKKAIMKIGGGARKSKRNINNNNSSFLSNYSQN